MYSENTSVEFTTWLNVRLWQIMEKTRANFVDILSTTSPCRRSFNTQVDTERTRGHLLLHQTYKEGSTRRNASFRTRGLAVVRTGLPHYYQTVDNVEMKKIM